MLEVQPKDSRGYFVLPQAPEQAGYYVYGVPDRGRGQFAHPALLSVLFLIEREWQAMDDRKFGIGNISLADGKEYPKHRGHQQGIDVDLRPVRRDKLVGQSARVSRFDAAYDLEATTKLIRLFANHPSVSAIYFNDERVQHAIPGRVRSLVDHDDHFHVKIRI
ncbi:penicillin-insensitive murein endopeptidase [Massilia endophytica]|uniref:penicillin-insensitive murein endopeptidase n=1 Tax=Massilia endophytica TaxID=2899220 RepID=UPI001E637710|nr:penicillin-insensitive murein endopeptidase [Massilia endophytica]UGQ48875.1 penicillin-insensitive murein endopeptidase [Massilia endophytica]